MAIVASIVLSSSCRPCHEAAHDQWAETRHAAAWTNAAFRAGFAKEPKVACVKCHAPLEEMPWLMRESAEAHDGVSCVSCHGTEHASNPRVRSPAMCAGCHEFALTGQEMQTTYTEWLGYQAAGGAKTCQECHMPGGDHRVRGAYDLGMLQKALSVEVRTGSLVVRNRGAGHDVPSGDVFRRVSLEVDGRTIASFGRRYVAAVDRRTGDISRVLAEQTSLRPGEEREFRVPSVGHYRLVYHYAFGHDDRSRVIYEGALP